jgi:outer membrane lipoprotein-sorting protein
VTVKPPIKLPSQVRRLRVPRRGRWLVPVGAVVAVGLAIGASALVSAQSAAPLLPARTTAQLLAAVDGPAAPPPPMTATVQEIANLGLPSLPGSDSPMSAMTLLSGTHTFQIWYGGPTRFRVAMPVQLGETDLRRLGRDVWLWNSKTSQATHYVLPAAAANAPGLPAKTPSVPTPQQLARQLLAAVGKTTTVKLQQNVTVAGQPAYQLSLAPKNSSSLIGQITIAIDASNSMPLQVQVFARGASSPAFQLGFTSISFGTPAASNFAFTPPPGAKVKTIKASGALLPGLLGPLGLPGPMRIASVSLPRGAAIVCQSPVKGAKAVALNGKNAPKAVIIRIKQGVTVQASAVAGAKTAAGLPPKAAILCAQAIRGLPERPTGVTEGTPPKGGWTGFAPMSGSAPAGVIRAQALVPFAAAPSRVMGQGWTAVAVLPAGSTAGILGVLQGAATPVSGSWGSGHLLRTTLFSVLITSNGHVLIGAVQPSVLYADAAQLK